jgi:hypothetical protein
LVPKENFIDVEVLFNPSSIKPLKDYPTVSALNAQICKWNWAYTQSAPEGYTKNGGDLEGVVGIAFTGVPIFGGTSEANKDPLYPSPTTGMNYLNKLDACLGLVHGQTLFYHYYTFSPCMMTSTLKSATQVSACVGFSNCGTQTSTYMTAGVSKSLAAVGIALDGHIIYGPWKSATERWAQCDVDVCNGLSINGAYGYAMTSFHPYTIGCWGPGTIQAIQQSCSSNKKQCLTPP